MTKKFKAIDIVVTDEKNSKLKVVTWTNDGNGYDDEELAKAIGIIERGKNVLNYKVVRR